MKIKELIRILGQFDENMNVTVENNGKFVDIGIPLFGHFRNFYDGPKTA